MRRYRRKLYLTDFTFPRRLQAVRVHVLQGRAAAGSVDTSDGSVRGPTGGSEAFDRKRADALLDQFDPPKDYEKALSTVERYNVSSDRNAAR